MRRLLGIALCLVPFSGATGDEPDQDISRQALFESLQILEQRQAPFALPKNFVFPDSAREASSFGIDVS